MDQNISQEISSKFREWGVAFWWICFLQKKILCPAYNEVSYNEHLATASIVLCIKLLVVSGTQCNFK